LYSLGRFFFSPSLIFARFRLSRTLFRIRLFSVFFSTIDLLPRSDGFNIIYYFLYYIILFIFTRSTVVFPRRAAAAPCETQTMRQSRRDSQPSNYDYLRLKSIYTPYPFIIYNTYYYYNIIRWAPLGNRRRGAGGVHIFYTHIIRSRVRSHFAEGRRGGYLSTWRLFRSVIYTVQNSRLCRLYILYIIILFSRPYNSCSAVSRQ